VCVCVCVCFGGGGMHMCTLPRADRLTRAHATPATPATRSFIQTHTHTCQTQLLGLAGCGRKRLLLLWAALDVLRSGGAGPAATAAAAAASALSSAPGDVGPPPALPSPSSAAAAAAADVGGLLKLALLSMEPPEQPGQQVGGGVCARVCGTLLCFCTSRHQSVLCHCVVLETPARCLHFNHHIATQHRTRMMLHGCTGQ
jgi:hypothetical protein